MRKAVSLLLVAVWAATPVAAWADCKEHRGDKVVLYSTTDDPSVLIWDSRARLRSYYGASFDEAQAMLPHSILVAPGTRATVISCVADYIESPIFQRPEDAVGVTISSGPQRGVTRWVLGSDIRLMPDHH
ncbi:MAG: hypothetical protein JO146_02995 [Candidatus Eremiobacteraeota bacterium]|nr:hypothetical protein [Candidatus Eremiobacteraeota bacterium]